MSHGLVRHIRLRAGRGVATTALNLGGSPAPGMHGGLGSNLASFGSSLNTLLSLSLPSKSSSSSSVSSTSSSTTFSSRSSSSLFTSTFSSSSSSSSSSLPSSTSSLSTSSAPPSSSSSSSSTPSTSLPPVQPKTIVVTNTVAPSSANSALAIAPKPQTFLQNKSLSAGVFSVIGLVILVIVVILIATYVRRRSRQKLLREAADFSFDPSDVEERASNEKLARTGSRWSGSNAGYGNTAYNDDTSLTGHAAVPGVTYDYYDNGLSRGYPNTSYNVMANPYTTYGIPVSEPVRHPSPTYDAAGPVNAVGVAGPSANGYFPQNASHAPPAVQESNKIPVMAPLPDTFGNEDAYGGYVKRPETVDYGNIPQGLHIANE